MACRTALIQYAVMYLYIPYILLAVSLFYSVFFVDIHRKMMSFKRAEIILSFIILIF